MRALFLLFFSLFPLFSQQIYNGFCCGGNSQVVTSLGTTTATGATSITIASLTVTAPANIIIEVEINLASGVTATFNSVSCTGDVTNIQAGTNGYYIEIFSCPITMSVSSVSAVASWTGSKNANMQVRSISNSANAHADVTGSCNLGSNTNAPSVQLGASGTTCTGSTVTTQAFEVCIAVAGVTTGSLGGIWQNGFTGLNQTSQSGSFMGDAYQIETTTQAFTASKSGSTNTKYALGLACYKHS